MLSALLPVASTLTAISVVLPPPQGRTKVQPPPGLVLIEGGTTKIGSPVKYVEDIGKQNETLFGNIVRETPQHEMRLDDFFLMVTEVTNEQFAAYVKATGARPPEHWAEKVIDDASLEFVRKQGEEAEKAKAEGRPAPEKQKFVRSEWWRKNWEGKPWQIPKGKETHPVVYVDYQDAQAYARWAGLRLMTEFEYQRAGRGRGDNLYPWGSDAADVTRAATQEMKVGGREVRPAEPFRVASLQAGKTPEGIFDLCGNVWEWTASPYVAYPGYKDLRLSVGAGSKQRNIDGLTAWDANKRVAVGGCFQQSLFVARLTTRRGSERYESTDSLGFRCASSALPGLDLAQSVLRDDLPIEKRPVGMQIDGSKVLAADRWSSEPGTAKTIPAEGQPPIAVPGYAVITGYDYLMFIPATEIDSVSVKGLGDISHASGPVPMGVLSCTKPMIQPALERGTYVVSFRAGGAAPVAVPANAEKESKDKGKEKDKDGDKKGIQEGGKQDEKQEPAAPKMAEFKAPPGFDYAVDALIFYTPDGEPKAWIPAPNIDYAKPAEPKVTVISAKRPYVIEKPGGLKERHEEDAALATLSLTSWVRVSNKGFTFNLPLWFKTGEVGSDWRMR